MDAPLEILVGIRDAPGKDGQNEPHYFFALARGEERCAYWIVPMTTSWWAAQEQGLRVLAQAMSEPRVSYQITDGFDMTSQGKRRSCTPVGEHRLQDVLSQLPHYLTPRPGAP